MAFSIRRGSLAILVLSTVALAADFTWDYRNQEVIGRSDTSLNNTSKLSEPERNGVLDKIIVSLMKPLGDRGYEDDRIREIATTTRVRFVDVGEGKTVLMASSLGLEGGCDALQNCPFWVFRKGTDGYESMLQADAATYTIQPTNTDDYSDLLLSRHVTAEESRLTLYKFADGKYVEAGCYTAVFPAAKEDEQPDPEIAPCKKGGE
jgi:hypothetical protein